MAANGMKPKGGPRPGSGRKPVAATVLKEQIGDRIKDAKRAFELCVGWMDDPTWDKSLRLAAAKEVMDRVLGKSVAMLEHAGVIGVSFTDLISKATSERGLSNE